jgi:hypothetical protein
MPPRSRAFLAVLAILPAALVFAEDGLLQQARKGAAAMPAAAGAAQPDRLIAAGPRTWAFVVGLLEWKDKDHFGSFPKKDRRDAMLVQLLQKEYGVPADHILYYQDAKASRAALDKGLAAIVSRAQPGDTLIFYYAGHGERVKPGVFYFVPYDAKGGGEIERTGWPAPQVFTAIDSSFKGSRVIMVADACYSGGLAIEAAKRGGKVSYAVLASAEASSPSTGNWTFTDALLRALSGEKRLDGDRDGFIDVAEFVRHAELEMAVTEQQLPAWTTTGALSPRSVLAKVSRDSAPTPQETARIPFTLAQQRAPGARVQVQYEDQWFPAVVKDYKLGLHRVKYDNFGEYWDEWVSEDRIKDPKK